VKVCSLSNNNVAILYLSIGSGRQSAAEALADAMNKGSFKAEIVVKDPFANTVNILPPVLTVDEFKSKKFEAPLFISIYCKRN